MPTQTRIVSPGPNDRCVICDDGRYLDIPNDWELLPPGDAGLTRRVKAAGPTWTVKEKKGRRVFSRGVWANKEQIRKERLKLEAERSTDAYAKKQEQAAKRRDKQQAEYVEDFRGAILQFLKFDAKYEDLAQRLADAVSNHATPVGSGTVARTKRIPIERRAESAVIAWMRHQTTAYDNMKIERIKGKRREVRRLLAEKSRSVLERYRHPQSDSSNSCPLKSALSRSK